MPGSLGKTALVVVAVAIAVLVVEGVLSLGFRRSLRPSPFPEMERFARDTQRQQIAAELARFSEQRVHVDPRVGWTYTPGVRTLLRAQATIGANGLRERPGPPAAANALRIVVLGDSVAFGLGLTDDQTIAARLESHLNASRGASARPVAAWTVALPGWNCKSAIYALLDSIDEVRPDVVVYVPLGNDLVDAYAVWQDGLRHVAPDVTNPDPLLLVNDESRYAFQREFVEQVHRGEISTWADSVHVGPVALIADLSPESTRRIDDNAHAIAALDARLKARAARLAVLFYDESKQSNAYVWHLRARLAQLVPDALMVPGFAFMDPKFSLGFDGHPNPQAADALALYVASAVLEAGVIERGEGHALPALAPEYRDAQAKPITLDEARAASVAIAAAEKAIVQPVIDLSTGQGMLQIYGGLNADGTIGPRFCALLARHAQVLRVTLEPLPDEARRIAPLTVDVSFNGIAAGRFVVAGDGRRTETIALPASVQSADLIEVKLVPSDWTVHKIRDYEVNASFRLLELAATDPP